MEGLLELIITGVPVTTEVLRLKRELNYLFIRSDTYLTLVLRVQRRGYWTSESKVAWTLCQIAWNLLYLYAEYNDKDKVGELRPETRKPHDELKLCFQTKEQLPEINF